MSKNRAIPREYFKVLADKCPLNVWQEIVQVAVEQALEGNAGARTWLAKMVLPDGMTLMDLAKIEHMGVTRDESIETYKGPVVRIRK